jgi:predicted DCC family thiol-disulfide oxidoreductase YuxK
MSEHLLFFDETCPFCHKAVRNILEIDVYRRFMFSPLSGKMAKDLLTGPQKELMQANSLILVENYQSTERQFWIRSHALYRVYWLAGNGWWIVGCLSFLIPKWLGDAVYRWVAEHRHQFKLQMPESAVPPDRLLP